MNLATIPAAVRPLGPLFTGADSGIHTLPADVLDLRRALTHLLDTPPLDVPDEGDLTRNLVADTVAAAHRGDDPPDVSALVDAGRVRAVADARRRVLDEAAAHLAGDLRDSVIDGAETIIIDHLRPAFTDLVAGLRSLVATFSPYGTSPGALLRAPDKARRAFLSLSDLSGRWSALSASRSVLASAGYAATADEASLFGLVRNADAFTDMTRSRPVSKIADGLPWRALSGDVWFLWFGTHPDADLWLPTPAEQDARYLDLFGARIAEHTRHQQRAALAHAMAA